MPDIAPPVQPAAAAAQPPLRTRKRRLPAFLRLAVAALLGMAVAGLASYLMRTIGF